MHPYCFIPDGNKWLCNMFRYWSWFSVQSIRINGVQPCFEKPPHAEMDFKSRLEGRNQVTQFKLRVRFSPNLFLDAIGRTVRVDSWVNITFAHFSSAKFKCFMAHCIPASSVQKKGKVCTQQYSYVFHCYVNMILQFWCRLLWMQTYYAHVL